MIHWLLRLFEAPAPKASGSWHLAFRDAYQDDSWVRTAVLWPDITHHLKCAYCGRYGPSGVRCDGCGAYHQVERIETTSLADKRRRFAVKERTDEDSDPMGV